MTIELNRIYNIDCLDGMLGLNDNSVDLITTDPPYGMKFMSRDWDKALPSIDIWKECLRVLKPGAFTFVMCIPRQDCLSKMISNLSDAGFRTDFTSIYWTFATGFPKAHNIGKAIDKKAGKKGEEYIREDFAKRSNKIEQRKSQVICGQKGVYNKLVTPEAKALEGSYAGFQPKPAVEVIIVAMKPLSEKNYTEQAISNKKGVTWLDDCRIPYKSGYTPIAGKRTASFFEKDTVSGGDGSGGFKANDKGRFPANLLVSDEVLGEHSKFFRLPFLITPKASKSEKNKGLEDIEAEPIKGRDDGQDVRNVPYKQRTTPVKNQHPTVKPIKLMSYLITMGSREGDLVVDPFGGSGTTSIACKLLDRKYILFEISKEYVEIANKRLKEYDNRGTT